MNGGSIAIGHPLGATGARLVMTLAKELHRSGGRYALATQCIGAGMGISTIWSAWIEPVRPCTGARAQD